MMLAVRSLALRPAGAAFRVARAAPRLTNSHLETLSCRAVGSRRNFSSFNITFASAEGEEALTVSAKSGQTILEVAHEHDVDIEGACGGECACSTCHVILSQEDFDNCQSLMRT